MPSPPRLGSLSDRHMRIAFSAQYRIDVKVVSSRRCSIPLGELPRSRSAPTMLDIRTRSRSWSDALLDQDAGAEVAGRATVGASRRASAADQRWALLSPQRSRSMRARCCTASRTASSSGWSASHERASDIALDVWCGVAADVSARRRSLRSMTGVVPPRGGVATYPSRISHQRHTVVTTRGRSCACRTGCSHR